MRRPRGLRRRAAAVGAVTLSAGLLLGAVDGPAGAAGPSRTGSAVPGSCPASPASLTPAQASSLLTLAGRRYGPAADTLPGRYPFGAIGSERVWTRKPSDQWTSGFFPATLWTLYEATGSRSWLLRARRWTDSSLPLATWRSPRGHDLGFMVGLPTGLAARLDPSPARRATYRAAQLTAARTLSRFYDPRVGALASTVDAGRPVVIVDDAMNGTSLIEAARLAGPVEARRLRAIGTTHLRTLARLIVRPDGSTYHRLAVDPVTRATTPLPGQGSDPATSTWTRGQAWAVAGFARGYALTGDATLLAAARRTADYWGSRLPVGCVPAWDFDAASAASVDSGVAPAAPVDSGAAPPAPMDSGAAAILADGLLDLAAHDPDPSRRGQWREAALRTLGTLLADPWWTRSSGRPGVLWRQTYNVPADDREGSYVWGDHYLIAAVVAARVGERR